MLKRWAAWPQGIRWLAGIAAVVLALVIVWVLFVPVADWLAHHDVGSAKGPLHETALDNARGRLLALGAGLFAAGALLFTARNFTLSREGQVTERYTKAIEQLGSDKLDVRIGGIYALERVARDSARDHPTVMEVLTAFIREHSHEKETPSGPGSQEQARSTRSWLGLGLATWTRTRTTRTPSQQQVRSTRPDIQAAVTVVGRRNPKRDIRPIDLTGANLFGADLTDAKSDDVSLFGATLTRVAGTGADLALANLTRADLTRANLARADLTGANLAGADLTRADLTGADLTAATLAGATLAGATLARAILAGVILDRAILAGADLALANLADADLTRADLTGADLTGANLDGAWWPGNALVPAGWKLGTGSGRLERQALTRGRQRQARPEASTTSDGP